jgi:uncharacterized membrane protein YhaH (DUF805 family)
MRSILSFSGKADRFEWWTVSLVADLVAQLGLIFGWIVAVSDTWYRVPAAGALFVCAALALWAAIAVSVRRMNDRERPPWLLVLALVPVVGWIWLVVECGILPAPGSRVRKKLVRRIVKAPAEEE